MTTADSPDETFFNDLSQQAPGSNTGASYSSFDPNTVDDNGVPKPKRIACVLCRKRKLRCDGTRPTCGTCKRLAHDCAYDEVRRKSGPKRGYVKALEARLHQVETLLKSQDTPDPPREAQPSAKIPFPTSSLPPNLADASNIQVNNGDQNLFPGGGISPGESFANFQNGAETAQEDHFPWEIISLGLHEPLPPQEEIDELNRIYFAKVHPSIPMIHRPRYHAAMNLAPHTRPAVCLRYIMWCFAASLSDKYENLQEHFYQRARKYAQLDEMRGHGESTLTLGHCQAWILITTYEFKCMYFPRAWMSAGRAVRLAQMMGLHRQDGSGLDVKQCLPPPKDWVEREERRRTFWGAFCVDRYASIGTGWPMSIDERDILSNLPAPDEAYDHSKPAPTIPLEEALTPTGAGSLTSFGSVAVIACLLGRNLHHLHRPTPHDNDNDLNGGFWTRHRNMEADLLNISLSLPDHLRLPSAISNDNAIFANLCLHTSSICLHQAAIFKAEKNRMPPNISYDSKMRCVTAAAEIANIMRVISHMDLSTMNPFISFCVYVAARVFVQYIKTHPNDQQMTSSLRFLIQAMQVLKRRNPLTESFQVQLDVDLEAAGILGVRVDSGVEPYSQKVSEIPTNQDVVHCSPLVEIRDSQNRSGQNFSSMSHNGNNMYPIPTPPTETDAQPNGSGFLSGGEATYNATNQVAAMDGGKATSNIGRGIVVPVVDHSNDVSEMDTSPDTSADQATPSTINSHRGSSSHASFTPPSQNDETISQPLPYHTVRNPTTPSNPPTYNENGDTARTPDFFNTESDFGFYGNHTHSSAGPGGYGVQTDWTAGNASMTDSSWGQMLDGIGMGWEPVGTLQQQVDPLTGRRVS